MLSDFGALHLSVFNVDSFMAHSSWLKAQGSWLMARGSRLAAHGQEKSIGAKGPKPEGPAPHFSRPGAMSLQSRSMKD